MQLLELKQLQAGDRLSLYALAVAITRILEEGKPALIGVDALGLVHLLPPPEVKVLVPDAILNQITEDAAVAVMQRENRSEDDMINYLAARSDS